MSDVIPIEDEMVQTRFQESDRAVLAEISKCKVPVAHAVMPSRDLFIAYPGP